MFHIIELVKFFSSLFVSFCGIVIWPFLIGIVIYSFRNSINRLLEDFWEHIHPSEVNLLSGNIQLKFQENQAQSVKLSKGDEGAVTRIENQALTSPLDDKNQNEINLLLKSLKDSQQNNVQLSDQLNASLIKLHFEYVHNYIFASQYNLLQLLENTIDGYSMKAVEAYYLALPVSKLSTWTYVDYIKFLIDSWLVVIDPTSGNIKLTELGKVYLKYSQGLPMPFYLN